MTMIDPNLPGIWIVPGELFTYEVLNDGSYHVAPPAAPLSFSSDAAEMTWGAQVFDRQSASANGAGVEGRWTRRDSTEHWVFSANGQYQVRWGKDDPASTGIWALRDNGGALWIREKLAELTTDGAQVVFNLIGTGPAQYGYTVEDGVWTLLDPDSWEKRATYRRP
ncbi:hypothetical protein E2K80_11115 [Rhodophyticola sp. CCM32]|uniref:hypothetical protein n=1 Tax=Rhodophyticola sp. CCM32 TaxID=2916397 RepID=UPI00107FD14A|nr:hypothetical protein [Rhodophyticola sp. CCM32]QBY01208.1 hypothetical protein E2K80_11115 [Rhodophyticola sp. CCM32]